MRPRKPIKFNDLWEADRDQRVKAGDPSAIRAALAIMTDDAAATTA